MHTLNQSHTHTESLSITPSSSPVTSASSTVGIKTSSLTLSSPTPKTREIPLVPTPKPHETPQTDTPIDTPNNDDSTINNVPTNQITPSHTSHPHPPTSHLDQQPSQFSLTQTVSDVKPGNIHPITTVPHDRDISATPLLGNTHTIGIFPMLTSVEPSAADSTTSTTDSLLPTNTLEPDIDLTDFGGNPPTVRGIDEAVSVI